MAKEFAAWSVYNYVTSNPIILIDSDGKKPSPKEAALMANHVYGKCPDSYLKGGWKPSTKVITGLVTDSKSGLEAKLYERKRFGKIEYAFVYAGTEDLSDIKEDVTSLFGFSEQFDEAKENANTLKFAFNNHELTFIGHSLGGALSNMSSLITGKSSITFNPMWIPMAQIWKFGLGKKSDEFIDNYIIAGEPLDLAQKSATLPGMVPMLNQVGNDHYLYSAYSVLFCLSVHQMITSHKDFNFIIGEINDVPAYKKIWDEKSKTWKQ